MNRAIGLCYALKQEIHYVIRTLPVDINKYEHFAEAIDKQISLFKGVRKSDNRLIKPNQKKPDDPVQSHLAKILDGLTFLIHKVRTVETADKT